MLKNSKQSEELGVDVDHLNVLVAVLNQTKMSFCVERYASIEMSGTTYVVYCRNIDGHRIILVKSPFIAVYFPNDAWRWGLYNDAERCFAPFVQDPELYSELNASFFANRMESSSMLQCLFMPRLSALRGERFFVRYTKADGDLVMDGLCDVFAKTVSVIRMLHRRMVT